MARIGKGSTMRTRFSLIVIATVALAACSSGTTAAPSPSTEASSPAPVVTPAAPAAAPSPDVAVAAVPVQVHFDGEKCTYLGPEAFPTGTLVDFRFTATPETADMVALIAVGATKDIPIDVLDQPHSNSPIPPWALQSHEALLIGPGSMLFTMTYRDVSEVAVFVGCTTDPATDNTMYPAALLWAIGE